MPKYLLPALISGAAAAVMIFLVPGAKTYVLGWILAGCALVLLFMSVSSAIARKKSRSISGWKLFAAGTLFLMAVLLTVGLINSSNILGAVLLSYGLPIFGAMLILEVIVYKAVNMYRPEEKSSENPKSPEIPESPGSTKPPRIAFPAKDKPENKD